MAAALKLQGPRPLADSWPPLSVVKDKEVVQAAEKCDSERVSDVCCHGPLHILENDESWSADTSKTFTQISSIEARVDLESYCLSSKVLRDISFSLPVAMQSRQQKACKNCPCDDYST